MAFVFLKPLGARPTLTLGDQAYGAVVNLRSGAATYGFPVDNTGYGGNTYTKCTNVGLDILSTLVAVERGQEDPEAARRHLARVAQGLSTLRMYKGIFPEYIKLTAGGVFADNDGGTIRFSSVDSAWLHFALSVASDYYAASDPALAKTMAGFVRQADYTVFLRDSGGFAHGFTLDSVDDRVVKLWDYDYDNKNSEARLLVVFLTAAGKLPEKVWRGMEYRYRRFDGIDVAEGWKMSAFVELAANSYFDEHALAPRTLGASHSNYLAACRRVAAGKNLQFFGWGPCYGPDDRYREYGLEDPSVATPYAAALLSTVDDPEGFRNYRRLLAAITADASGVPFPDALDPATGKTLNRRALSLNQNLLYHALAKRTMRQVVAKARWHRQAERLVKNMDDWHQPPKNFIE